MIRWGILFRKQRHIPYERIQNIDAVQGVVQRLCGVVTVVVQTGSGTEPEVTLSVLPFSALAEMRERVFAGKSQATAKSTKPDAWPRTKTFGRLTIRSCAPAPRASCVDVVGVHRDPRNSSRPRCPGPSLAGGLRSGMAGPESLRVDPGNPMGWILSATTLAGSTALPLWVAALIVVSILFVRLLSMLWALVRLYNFTLTRRGDDLRAEYGLLTRVTGRTIPIRRIQTVSVHEGFVHRWMNRVAVRVTTAGGGAGQAGTAEREWVAPIIERRQLGALLGEFYPGLQFLKVWTGTGPTHGPSVARSDVGC